MLPVRKPKRRPSDVPCPACGQMLGWESCEGCQGYGSWDPGLAVFDCVLCGGVGWHQEPHACPAAAQDHDASAAAVGRDPGELLGPASWDEPAGGSYAPEVGDEPSSNGDATAGRRLRHLVLLAIVLVVLFLVLASAGAGLLASFR